MRHPGVYMIRHIDSGRCYIGSSKDIRSRIYVHISDLKLNRHHSAYLQRVWNKYGEDAFAIEVLEECPLDRKTILEREQHYLDTVNPVFNGLKIAGSRLGHKATPETIAKMRAVVITQETRDKMAAAKFGTNKPAETRARMSAAHAGRPKAAEATAKGWETKVANRFAKNEAIRAELATRTIVKQDVRRTLRKLTDAQIIEIRNSKEPARTLCKRFNCCDTTINKIRRGLIYRDVT